MRMEITLYQGASALEATDTLAGLYREAFCAPPWNEDETKVAAFTGRLRSNVERPGFVAAVAHDAGRAVGFGTAWRTRAPFPSDRRYPDILAQLGPDRVDAWLIGAQEVDELAVASSARGHGIGPRLLDNLTGLDQGHGTWLITSMKSPAAVRFYQRCGWHQITERDDAENDEIVVFLSPQHPHMPAGRVSAGTQKG